MFYSSVEADQGTLDEGSPKVSITSKSVSGKMENQADNMWMQTGEVDKGVLYIP